MTMTITKSRYDGWVSYSSVYDWIESIGWTSYPRRTNVLSEPVNLPTLESLELTKRKNFKRNEGRMTEEFSFTRDVPFVKYQDERFN